MNKPLNMKTYSRKQIYKKNSEIDFENVCRLCLSKSQDMYYLYEESLYLPMRIKACINLDVEPFDGLPTFICDDCLGRIENAYSFREACLRADTTLRQTLLKNGNGKFSKERKIKIITESSRKKKVEIPEDQVSGLDQIKFLSISPVKGDLKLETVTSQIKESNKNKENNPMQESQTTNASVALPFQCSKCPKKFERRMDLRRHESVHNTQKGYDCEFCEKWLPNKNSFERHKRIHTGEKPYACQYCGKTFSQTTILQRHFLIHTGQKPFRCDECNKGFTQRVNLRAHIRKYHQNTGERSNMHKCPLCNKAFCHPSGLSRHLIRHTGKTYRCPICKKPFTDPSSVKRHIKRHDDPPATFKEEKIEIAGTYDHFALKDNDPPACKEETI